MTKQTKLLFPTKLTLEGQARLIITSSNIILFLTNFATYFAVAKIRDISRKKICCKSSEAAVRARAADAVVVVVVVAVDDVAVFVFIVEVAACINY